MHIVTGASGGLGRAVAEALAAAGEPVLGVARREGVLAGVARRHPTMEVVAADVTTPAGRRAIVDRCRSPVASVVHGAGSRVAVQSLASIDVGDLLGDVASHVGAVLAVTRDLAGGPGLERMVVFDSYSATTPRVGWAGYSIVKAAAQAVARAVDAEYPDVDVLRLYPGAVRTPLLRTMLESPPSPARDVYRDLDRTGSVADPGEIGTWVRDILVRPRSGSAVMHFDDERRRPTGPLSGGCLCRSVRYRLDGPLRDVIECHCHRCRRATGHHMAATAVDPTGLEIADDSDLRWFAPADDPDVQYGFCGRCGSTLFWRSAGVSTVSVSAGTIDPPTGLRTKATWFVDHSSDYVIVDHTVPTWPTQPGL